MDGKPHGNALRKGRVSIGGQIYLVTCVTHGRTRLFDDLELGRIVVRAMAYQHVRRKIESLAFVVMPDHLHWLFTLGDGEALSERVQVLKTFAARQINQHLGRTGMPVWQHGFHDRAIRRDEDLRAVARYIVANPLRAGLVESIGDYPLWDAAFLP